MKWSARLERRWAECLTAGAPDSCWEWTGRTDAKGYGFIKVSGRTTRVHRVAWARAHGNRWPRPGRVVRHTCDNPPCCNPAHLRLGTVRDNVRDCVRRGRRARGESLRQARLTESDVKVIRDRAGRGETAAAIAADYGFTPQGIRAVVNRKTWRHVA